MTPIALPREPLIAALRECLAWCAASRACAPRDASIAAVCRSPALAAPALDCVDGCFAEEHLERPRIAPQREGSPRPGAFAHFTRARRELLAASGRPLASAEAAAAELARPRSLVISDWRFCLFDGAAQAESQGWIDCGCLAPWDAWLVEHEIPAEHHGWSPHSLIVSWVPPWAGDLVDAGVYVIPEACMAWAYDDGQSVLVGTGGERWEHGRPSSR